MTVFSKLAALIWRDYATDGVPGSGAHQPVKQDIRTWGSTVEAGLADAEADATAALTGSRNTDIQLAQLRAAQMAAAAPFQR